LGVPFLKKERGGLGVYPEPSRRVSIFSDKNRKRISTAIPNAALSNDREVLCFYQASDRKKESNSGFEIVLILFK